LKRGPCMDTDMATVPGYGMDHPGYGMDHPGYGMEVAVGGVLV